VSASVAGLPVTLSWVSDGIVTLETAPATGSLLIIERSTPRNSSPVEWTASANILEPDLDVWTAFNLYLDQEALDKATTASNRSLRVPDDILALPDVATRRGGIVGFDPAGQPRVIEQPLVVSTSVTAVISTTTAAQLVAFPADQLFVITIGYAYVDDRGGALFKRVASEPTHAGKFKSANDIWFEHIDVEVSPEQFGVPGSNTSPDGLADYPAGFEAAAEFAKLRGRPLTARSRFYFVSALRSALATVERAGLATLVTPRGRAVWASFGPMPRPPRLPGRPSSTTDAGALNFKVVADGSRYYNAFPRLAQLPFGRYIAAFTRGLGHSPNYNKSPVDAEYPVTPTNPNAQYSDTAVAWSDDDCETWSAPLPVAGNMQAGGTRYAYGQAIGLNHAGRMVLLTVEIPPGDANTYIYQQESTDGVVWSPQSLMQVTSINYLSGGRTADPAKAGQISGNGQRVFGDIIRLPTPGRLAVLACHLSIGVKYLALSDDDGKTWTWKSIYLADAGASPPITITEEGAVLALSDNEIVTIHRGGGATTAGYTAITRDRGDTWTWLNETSTTLPTSGGALPHALHTARIDNAEWVIAHVGMRTSNSGTATPQSAHYVLGTPAEALMRGQTTKWEVLRRIVFPSFNVWDADNPDLAIDPIYGDDNLFDNDDGVRDLYIGVVFDPVTQRFAAVTHDELEDNRHALVVAYGADLVDGRVTSVAATTLTADALTMSGKVSAGGWLYIQDSYSPARVGNAAAAGIRLLDYAGTTVAELGRPSSDGTIRLRNLLANPNNTGFLLRGLNDAGTEETYASADKTGLKPGPAQWVWLRSGLGPPPAGDAASVSWATKAYFDVTNKVLYIAVNSTWYKTAALIAA